MAKITLSLDNRRPDKRGQCAVVLRLSHKSVSTTISTGVAIKPEYWLGEINQAVATKCPNAKQLNRGLEDLYFKYSNALRELDLSGELDRMSAADIRRELLRGPEVESEKPEEIDFVDYYKKIQSTKSESTASIYDHTLKKILKFSANVGKTWSIKEINADWLRSFEAFLRSEPKYSVNGINLNMRNIRSVVNAALDDDLIDKYPFRKYKLRVEETAKRSLTIEELRTLMSYECEPYQVRYRDMFMLIFYLIGINTIDLFNLKEIANGRIEYRRSKTGHLFSIKVEPEAQTIIDKYRGVGYLLNVLDEYGFYKDFAHRMNESLQKIGPIERKGLGGKKILSPLFPKLTTYWARHTWATIAAELDIPDATISMALGHSSGNRVTNIYIKRDQKKVDDANRKVIDYVLKNNLGH